MSDPVNSIADWLRMIMSSWGLSDALITLILAVLGVVVLATMVLIIDILLVWIERKMVARFQDCMPAPKSISLPNCSGDLSMCFSYCH